MRRAVAGGAVAALAALAVVPAAAHAAYYGLGATVVSASLERQELADDRTLNVDLSADGRFAAFDTRATNFFPDGDLDPAVDDGLGGTIATDRLGGVFRRDLQTGRLELVADGDLVREDDGTLLARGARNPSVSADGRWVAFSTAQRLVPEDTDAPRHVDVYVRDMSRPLCRPLPGCEGNPYTLVSARDGGATPLTYAAPLVPVPSGNNGAELTAGTAISGDGRTVAFRTTAGSDVGRPPGDTSTGLGQLLVRDLDAQATRLVTRVQAGEPDAGAPAGGALGPAVLAGGGGAIAWVGNRAARQTRVQPGEPESDAINYYLWQRLDAGDGAPTRRVTGFVDPDDPACAPATVVSPTAPNATGPCYGVLQSYEEAQGALFATPPALTDDGWEVAYLTSTPARSSGQVEGTALDLLTTSMRTGISRKAATTELTREVNGDSAGSGPVSAVAFTPDGRQIAVATSRTRFTFAALRLTGAVRAVPRVQDLYLVDRAAGTIERVLLDAAGGDVDADVDPSLSVSAGARRIAFTSSATDLFRGDANQRADAFVITEQPRPVFTEPPPEAPVAEPAVETETIPAAPVLSVRVLRASATGERVLEVRAPASGSVAATAGARLPGKDGRRSADTKVTTVSRARARVRARRRVRLTLRLGRAQRTLLRKVRTLAATTQVRWTPDDRSRTALSRRVTVRFVVVKTSKKTSSRSRRSARVKKR